MTRICSPCACHCARAGVGRTATPTTRGSRDGRQPVGARALGRDALATEPDVVDEVEHECSSSDAEQRDTDGVVIGQPSMESLASLTAPRTPSPHPHPPLASANHTSYLLTGIAIAASILGRMSAQELRYDSARLFRNQESSRALSLELRRRRQEYKDQEGVRLAAEQKRRVVEVTEKARQDAERQKKAQEKYEKMAREEEARRRKELEASQREYEETQRKLDEEYQERLRKEQEALAEARRLDQERREREERERREELARRERERLEREAAEQRAREEAAAARIQARRDAENEMSKFAVRLEGSLEVSMPPAGTLLPGPMREEANVRLTARTSSLMGGDGQVCEQDFHLPADMASAAPSVVASAARSGMDNVASALQLQKMGGQGPLMLMEPPEMDNWMRCAVVRATLKGLAALDVSNAASVSRVARTFDCRTESGVLPADHPLSYQQVFAQMLDRIVEDPSSRDTAGLFMEAAGMANDAFYDGLGSLGETHALLATYQKLGVCLFLAHFIDRSLYARPAREADAPAWFETCAEFCRQRLNETFEGSPPDSLSPLSSLMTVVLGGSHPIAVELADLAERNTSEQAKLAAAERERARKAILAARLLEEEWPDEEEMRKARARERESKTPVTERIWALRNVASSLAIGTPGEMSRARQLLEQAVLLKQDMCESKDHPAIFPEALLLLKVIRGPSEWKEDASGVASLFLRISMNIGDGYERLEDHCSACIVLEMALKETEDAFVSLRNSATLRCVKRLEELSSQLSTEDSAALAASRRDQERVENFLSSAFTDSLGAYQKDGMATRRKHELWDEEGARMLGKL